MYVSILLQIMHIFSRQSALKRLKSRCVESGLHMIVQYLTTRAVVTFENSGRCRIPAVIASMESTAATRYPGKRECEINDRSTSCTTHNLRCNAPFDYDGIITGKTEHSPLSHYILPRNSRYHYLRTTNHYGT